MLDTLLGLSPQASDGWTNKDPADDHWYTPRGTPTVAGVDVSEESAMRLTTVAACVTKLSKTIATLPAHVRERTGPKDSRPVDHPLNEIFSLRANSESTGTTLRESMMANGLLWGNQYARRINNRRGELDSLRLMQASATKPMRGPSGELVFEYRPDDAATPETLSADEVLHIPNFSINGVVGLSPIALNRAAIALGQACVDFGSAVFGNGAWASGFIRGAPASTDPKRGLSKDAAKSVIESMNAQFRGASKAFGVGMLRGDMVFEQLKMPGEDLEFLLTRQFQRVEICGIFDVPPSKIQDLDKATFSNVEQQDLGWAKDAIVPWVVRIEMAINNAFFRGTNFFFKINVDGLMRGDFKSRMEGFAIGRQWGIYSINDTRALLDMPPIEDGDDYLTPMNMDIVGQPRITLSLPQKSGDNEENKQAAVAKANATLDEVAEATAIAKAQASIDLVEAFRPAVEDAARRVTGWQSKAVNTALRRHTKTGNVDAFGRWADKFYSTFGTFVRDVMAPIVVSFEAASGCKVDEPAKIAIGYADACYAMYRRLTILDDGPPVAFAGLVELFLEAFSQAIRGDSDAK